MSASEKEQAVESSFDVHSPQLPPHTYTNKSGKSLMNAQLALNTLSLLCGLVVLGTSANVAAVYNTTRMPLDIGLSLWPDELDLRPTNALVAGSVLVVLVKIVALLFGRIHSLQKRRAIHSAVTLLAPTIGFISVFVAIVVFYAINASTTTDTVQSWSCQWTFAAMSAKPYFDSLCKESKTSLYLSIILIPIELASLAVAGYQLLLEKKATGNKDTTRSNSPSLA